MRALIVATILTIASSPAIANQRTDQLYWKCTGREDVAGFALCVGYMDGTLDMHSLMVGLVGARPMICLPAGGISIDQAMRVFTAWVERNPDQMHLGARGTVALALAKAFPCR